MSDDFAVESVAQSFLAPSGVQATGAYDQINDPVSVFTGAPVATAQNTLSGSDKNTAPGPAIFKLNKYDVMWQAYWGTGGFYDGTILRKMTTEVDDQYLLRRAISFYRNFLKQIIDATYKPVFSDGVMRTTKIGEQIDNDGDIAPQWNAFLENVDNRRHGIGNFCKRAVKNARILETCFVVIDNFPNIPVDLDVKTAVKNRIFPYLYIRLPQQVEESESILDDFGKVQQIMFKEMPEEYFDPELNHKVTEPRWKLWTVAYSVKMRKNPKTNQFEELSGTKSYYDLGEVPVIPVMSSESEDGTILPHPSFYDIARCNWAIYNFDSAEARAICAQMFPILIRPTPSGFDAGNAVASNPMQGMYEPPAENGRAPASTRYLEYPTTDFNTIAEFIKTMEEDLFRQAGQLGVVATGSKQQSGESKAYDFHAMQFVLKETSKMAKNLELEIARMFKLYVKSESTFDYDVLYEEDFQPDAQPVDDVKLYTSFIDMGVGPKGKALALKMCALSVFDDADEDEVAEVIDEIKEMSIEEVKNRNEIPPIDPNAPPKTPEELAAEAAAAALDAKNNPADPSAPVPPKKVSKGVKRGFSLKKNKAAA
jgi:hypothetical protein